MAERIEIKSLSKNYKSHKVIENMNVTFPGGKIIGILGPNGSGKHRLTRAHREKQLKMSCQALHNAPPNRT